MRDVLKLNHCEEILWTTQTPGPAQYYIPDWGGKTLFYPKTEFETDDGTVHPIPFELDEIPTIEEFQKIYDEWFRLFQQKDLIHTEQQRHDN